MAQQIFHPSFNTIAKASIFGAIFIVALLGWFAYAMQKSPYFTEAGVILKCPKHEFAKLAWTRDPTI